MIFAVTLFVTGSIRASVLSPALATHSAPNPAPSEHGPLPVTIRAAILAGARVLAPAAVAAKAAARMTRTAKRIRPTSQTSTTSQ